MSGTQCMMVITVMPIVLAHHPGHPVSFIAEIRLVIKICWFYLLKICAVSFPSLLARLRNRLFFSGCLFFSGNSAMVHPAGQQPHLFSVLSSAITAMFLETPSRQPLLLLFKILPISHCFFIKLLNVPQCDLLSFLCV